MKRLNNIKIGEAIKGVEFKYDREYLLLGEYSAMLKVGQEMMPLIDNKPKNFQEKELTIIEATIDEMQELSVLLFNAVDFDQMALITIDGQELIFNNHS